MSSEPERDPAAELAHAAELSEAISADQAEEWRGQLREAEGWLADLRDIHAATKAPPPEARREAMANAAKIADKLVAQHDGMAAVLRSLWEPPLRDDRATLRNVVPTQAAAIEWVRVAHQLLAAYVELDRELERLST